MTDIDRLIDELVRRLRGRPILEIVTAARQIENRVRDLYLHEALRKYAADRREEPSRHVVAALRRLLGHDARHRCVVTSPGPSRARGGSGAWTIRYSDG